MLFLSDNKYKALKRFRLKVEEVGIMVRPRIIRRKPIEAGYINSIIDLNDPKMGYELMFEGINNAGQVADLKKELDQKGYWH